MIRAIGSKLKSNTAFVYSFGNRITSAGTSVITIFFITSFFTPELQGYYYIYNNLILLNFLLDVGFGVVLIQFVSHEWAHLFYNANGDIDGDISSKARLASLIRMSLKWYAYVALFFLILIGVGGYFFIGLQSKNLLQFVMPWFLLVLSVSGSILLAPVKSLLEGSNQIAKNQLILLLSTFFGAIVMWVGIYFNLGLFALGMSTLGSLIVSIALLRKPAIEFLKLRNIEGVNDNFFWKNEFRRQQLKIGASWLLGYFMLQSFVPLAFKLLNPVEAGKIGATMQLFNLVNMIGMIWVNVIGPKFGLLGAHKDYEGIKQLVRNTLKKSILSSFAFSVCIIGGIYLAKQLHIKQVERFSDMPIVVLILLSAIVAQVSNVLTTAIRFQKREPFLISTFVCTALQMLLIFLTVRWWGSYSFGIVFFAVLLIILAPWVYYIYSKEIKKLSLSIKE